MKKNKLFISISLLFFTVIVNGQYSEKWSAAKTDRFVGCENMDNDNNKEIVFYYDDPSEGSSFKIIDGITGNVEYSLKCVAVTYYNYSDDFNANPRLVAIDNSGKFSLMFWGVILASESEHKFHLISFDAPSSINQLSSINDINIENYPNPFNESTKIRYNVPNPSKVIIKLFDSKGLELKTILNEEKNVGEYEYTFNSGNLPSGIYYYQVLMDNFKGAKKMIIIK